MNDMTQADKPMNCHKFESCSAPLCPLDPSSLEHGSWFAGEPICTKQGIGFAGKQRKIMRARIQDDTCFTVVVLERLSTVRGGTRGINPDSPRAEAVQAWLERHPTRQPLSPERRAALAERMGTARHREK